MSEICLNTYIDNEESILQNTIGDLNGHTTVQSCPTCQTEKVLNIRHEDIFIQSQLSPLPFKKLAICLPNSQPFAVCMPLAITLHLPFPTLPVYNPLSCQLHLEVLFNHSLNLSSRTITFSWEERGEAGYPVDQADLEFTM